MGKSCLLLQFTDKRFQPVHDLTIGRWEGNEHCDKSHDSACLRAPHDNDMAMNSKVVRPLGSTSGRVRVRVSHLLAFLPRWEALKQGNVVASWRTLGVYGYLAGRCEPWNV